MIHSFILLLALVGGDSPNVVLILADDLGSTDLGCYGAKDLKTPNLDRLAASGVRWTQFYSAAPICSPARAALLTGKNPQRAGVPGNVPSGPDVVGMPAGQTTIAEMLRAAGRRTALFGKWHLGHRLETSPNGQGFDEFFGCKTGCIDYFTHIHSYGEWKGHDLWRDDKPVREDGRYFTDLLAREAVRFLEQNKDKPFFLYLPFTAPHYPLNAPDLFYDMYSSLPGDRRAYAALLSAMDASVGRVLDKIDRLGLKERTLVIFVGDNGATTEWRAGGGGGINLPYRESKFSLFDGGIHVPCLVSWPGTIPGGKVRSSVAWSLDVLPTIAEATGAALPADEHREGVSLLSALRDGAAIPVRTLCWQSHQGKAVRMGDWKLVVGPTLGLPAGAQWLSDLSTDPGETKNLAAERPAVVAKLLSAHAAWSKKSGL